MTDPLADDAAMLDDTLPLARYSQAVPWFNYPNRNRQDSSPAESAVEPSDEELIEFIHNQPPWREWMRPGGSLESAHFELTELLRAAILRFGATPPRPSDDEVAELVTALRDEAGAYAKLNRYRQWAVGNSLIQEKALKLTRTADLLEQLAAPPRAVPGAADSITAEDGTRWDHTMDAALWAKAFCAMYPGSDEGLMLAWFANAIMAGWDHQGWKTEKESRPVPVSERLPDPRPESEGGDCDAEGRCWLHFLLSNDPTWTLEHHMATLCSGRSHWLPAHALPLPEVGNGRPF